MSDLREALDERAGRFVPSGDGWDRLLGLSARRQRRRRALAAVLALTLFGGAAAGLWAAFQPPGSSSSTPAIRPRVTATIHVPGGVTDVAVGYGSVWAPGNGVVSRIDPRTNRVIGSIPLSGNSDYRDVAAGGGGVWVTDSGRRTVTRIDPATDEVVATIPLPTSPIGVATGFGSVWVSLLDRLVRIDPATNSPARLPLDLRSRADRVALGEDGIWIGAPCCDGDLERLDPATGRVVAKIRVQEDGPPAVGERSVWIPDHPFVVRIDARSGRKIAAIPVFSPGAMVVGGGFVWIVSRSVSTEPAEVLRIDPTTNRVAGAPIQVGMTPVGIAFGDGAVWVANFFDQTISRIDLRPCSAPTCAQLPVPTATPLPVQTPTPGAGATPSGEAPSSTEGFAVWPEDNPAQANQAAAVLAAQEAAGQPTSWRADPVQTATRFAGDVLGWTNVVAGPPEASPGGLVAVDVSDGSVPASSRPVIPIRLQKLVGGKWWSVIDVGPVDPAVSVSGVHVILGFDVAGAASIRLFVGYGDDRATKTVHGSSAALDLPTQQIGPGHVLILFEDSAGRVFDAIGRRLPAGE